MRADDLFKLHLYVQTPSGSPIGPRLQRVRIDEQPVFVRDGDDSYLALWATSQFAPVEGFDGDYWIEAAGESILSARPMGFARIGRLVSTNTPTWDVLDE